MLIFFPALLNSIPGKVDERKLNCRGLLRLRRQHETMTVVIRRHPVVTMFSLFYILLSCFVLSNRSESEEEKTHTENYTKTVPNLDICSVPSVLEIDTAKSNNKEFIYIYLFLSSVVLSDCINTDLVNSSAKHLSKQTIINRLNRNHRGCLVSLSNWAVVTCRWGFRCCALHLRLALLDSSPVTA